MLKIKRKEIKEIIEKINLPSKEFTQYKNKICDKYDLFSVSAADCSFLYEKVKKILNDPQSSEDKLYNALRSFKFLVFQEDFLMPNLQNILGIYENSIFSPSGKVRLGAVSFYDNLIDSVFMAYDFCKANSDFDRMTFIEFELSTLGQKFALLHENYINQNKDKLKKSDYSTKKVIFSDETKDKHLKLIRQTCEDVDYFFNQVCIDLYDYLRIHKVDIDNLKPINLKYATIDETRKNADFICAGCKKRSYNIHSSDISYNKYYCLDCSLEYYKERHHLKDKEEAYKVRRRGFDIKHYWDEIFLEYIMGILNTEIEAMKYNDLNDYMEISSFFFEQVVQPSERLVITFLPQEEIEKIYLEKITLQKPFIEKIAQKIFNS